MIAEEISEVIAKVHEKFFESFKKIQHQNDQFNFPLYEGGNITLDGSGNGQAELYKHASTRKLFIGRILCFAVSSSGVEYTPSSPWQNGYAYLFTQSPATNGSIPPPASRRDMLPNSAPGGILFPNVAEYSGLNAIHVRQNESVSFYVNGGPPNGSVYISIFGFMKPSSSDSDL